MMPKNRVMLVYVAKQYAQVIFPIKYEAAPDQSDTTDIVATALKDLDSTKLKRYSNIYSLIPRPQQTFSKANNI